MSNDQPNQQEAFDLIEHEPGVQEVCFPCEDSSTDKREVFVSVNVTAFQHEKFIEQCLESICTQQTDFRFEVLVGEDGSSDETRAICLKYAEKYPQRVRLILHDRSNLIKVHGKPTGRFNQLTNFKLGRGKYIAFCDGDDYWTDPEKLQKQATFLNENSSFAIAYHDMQKVDATGKQLSGPVLGERFCVDRSGYQVMAWKSPIHPSSAMVRRSHINNLPAAFREVMCADLFMLGFVAQHGKAGVVPVHPGAYRIHSGGIFSKKSQLARARYTLATYQKLLECLVQPRRSVVGERLCVFHNVVIWELLTARKFSEAAIQTVQLIRDVPGKIGWWFPFYQMKWIVGSLKKWTGKTERN